MRVHFHDVTPAAEGEKHGHEGPTHCGDAQGDYAYQIEQWVIDAGVEYPEIMHARCPALQRQWVRKGDTKEFEEIPWCDWVLGADATKAMSSLLANGSPEAIEQSKGMLAKMAGTTVPNGPNERSVAETRALAQGMATAIVALIPKD